MDFELLESYLLQTEKCLGDLPASMRAEAVTQVKTQALAAANSEGPGRPAMREVLQKLGSPLEVANVFRVSKGYPKVKSQGKSLFRWLAFSFLGSLFLFALVIALFLHFFSPLVEVSTDSDRVKIFGGLIDMDNSSGTFVFGHNGFSFDEERTHGSYPISPDQKIEIRLTNAKIKMKTSQNEELSYECLTSGPVGEPSFESLGNVAHLEIISTFGAKCTFSIPRDRQVALTGDNVKLGLESPHFSIRAEIGNGNVLIKPAKETSYRYETSVKKGRSQEFESSSDPRAYLISIHLNTGRITE